VLSFWEAKGVGGHRGARRCFPDPTSGLGEFCPCFSMVSVRVRVLAVPFNRCVRAMSLSGLFSGRVGFIALWGVSCGCRIWVVNLGRGWEQFLESSRLLGPQNLPLLFVSVFLWFFVVWMVIVVSGLKESGVSGSGVSGWGGGSVCEFSVGEAQGANGRRVD
jgi:hypothetical protein